MHFLFSLAEWQIWILTTLLIGIVTVFIEKGIHRNSQFFFPGRKLLHLIAVSGCALLMMYTQLPQSLGIAFLAAAVLLFILINKQLLQVQQDKSLGISLFPAAFGILLLCHPFIPVAYSATGAWILAIADPLAGLVGKYWGKQKVYFLQEPKSWIGATTFFFFTISLVSLLHPEVDVFSLILLSLWITVSELFSWKGSDNLSIPILTAIGLMVVPVIIDKTTFGISIAILLVIGIVAYAKKWLSISGITAAIGLAIGIILTHTMLYLSLPIVVLIMGSIITKIAGKESKKTEERNGIQVMANGFVGVLLLLSYTAWQWKPFIILAITAFAVSVCDTASSELGKLLGGTPVDIRNWKPIKKGLSGGISKWGTIGGATMLLIFCGIVSVIFHLEVRTLLFIYCFGFLGMLIDSIVGSLCQAKYINNEEIIETVEGNAQLIHGWKWMDNNLVNVLSICITLLLQLILLLLFPLYY